MMSKVSLFLLLSLTQPAPAPAEEQARVDDRLEFLSSIHIPKGTVAGEAICILCSIRVDGELRHEAVAVCGDVVVSGAVAGEVIAAGGNVRLFAGSKVDDEAIAVGGRVFRHPEAKVGSVEEAAFLYFPGQRSFSWPGTLLFAGAALLALLLSAGLLRDVRTRKMKAALRLQPARILILGVAGVALIGFLGGGTPVLDPLSGWGDLVLAAFLLVPAWLGSAGLVRLAGDWFFPNHPIRAVMVGSLALLLLMLVPVVGLLALLAVFLLGWGTSLLSGLGSEADWLFGRFRRQ